MIVKEITPPVKRVFQLDADLSELKVFRMALSKFVEEEEAAREAQNNRRMEIAIEANREFIEIPKSNEQLSAEVMLRDIREIERAGLDIPETPLGLELPDTF